MIGFRCHYGISTRNVILQTENFAALSTPKLWAGSEYRMEGNEGAFALAEALIVYR